jgi:hypothetical protein
MEKKPRKKPDGKCGWGCGRVTTNRSGICIDCLNARPETWEEWIKMKATTWIEYLQSKGQKLPEGVVPRVKVKKPRGKAFKKAKTAANFARPEEIGGELGV